MVNEPTIISYKDKDNLLVSHSQSNVLCGALYDLRYIEKVYGENAYAKPLDFGTYSHSTMENIMGVPLKQRDGIIIEMIETTGYVYDSFKRDLKKSLDGIKDLVNKYDHSEFKMNTNEMLLAFKAPDDWFPDDYKDIIGTIGDKIGKKYRGLGFRGKIDYYGRDLKEDKLYIVDWKTGRYTKEYAVGYLGQVTEYFYLHHINKYYADGARLEYIENKKNKKISTIDANASIDKGREAIKKILNTTVDKLRDSLDGKKPEKVPSHFACSSCGFNAMCRPSKINDMYYTDFKRI